MELEHITILMDRNMKVNGNVIYSMDSVLRLGLIIRSMKENIWKGKNLEEVFKKKKKLVCSKHLNQRKIYLV